jgi:hypothetical protein
MPLMDGIAAAGTSTSAAKDNHVHPTDTSRAPASGIAPTAIAGTAVITTDSRLADPRTPAAHKTSHQAGGTDELLLSQAQVASLQSDLAAKAALASPTFTGTPTVPGYVATPGAWTAYTPTLSGTGWSYGNATVDCAYTQVGKIVHVRGLIVWGSTSTFGAAAGPQMTLPVAGLSSTHRHLGYLTFFDSSASRNAPGVILVPSTTLMTPLYVREVGWLDALISTTPFAWATGDAFRFSLTYEAA